MIKKALLLSILIFQSFAFADCRQDAEENGDGFNVFDITIECFDEIKPLAKKRTAFNGEVTLYGYENMFFMEFSDPVKYETRPLESKIAFAGKELGFSYFEDGLISESKKQVIVLSDGKISAFRMNKAGNVAPVNSIISDKLRDAESIQLVNEDELKITYRGSTLIRYFKYQDRGLPFLREEDN